MSYSNSLEERINKLRKQDEDFFQEAFEGYNVPEKIKTASIAICRSCGIRGICDPMYIANIIAMSLGLGDGKSNFYDNSRSVVYTADDNASAVVYTARGEIK